MNEPSQKPLVEADPAAEEATSPPSPPGGGALRTLVRRIFGQRNGGGLRESLEELIQKEDSGDLPSSVDELALLRNILNLHALTAYDVMVPRADIVALDIDTSLDDLVRTMSAEAHSRIPVYRGTLDDVAGVIHIKDVLATWGQHKSVTLADILREVLFVAPSMPILELLLQMRVNRTHMALVVDEFGGVDGLVTIEDLVEEIVGEIEDEHDENEAPVMTPRPDGTLDADARVELDEFEGWAGPILTPEEREEDIDTLGGLVAYLAGRVPVKGELIRHSSGVEFEIRDADPRRIRRMRVFNLPDRDRSQEK